eukprot:4424704-Prymnesium_polylepis.1
MWPLRQRTAVSALGAIEVCLLVLSSTRISCQRHRRAEGARSDPIPPLATSSAIGHRSVYTCRP